MRECKKQNILWWNRWYHLPNCDFFLCSNIQPEYEYSLLIRYPRVCVFYHDDLLEMIAAFKETTNPWFRRDLIREIPSKILRTTWRVGQFSVSPMTMDIINLLKPKSHSFLPMRYHKMRIINFVDITTGDACEYLFGAPVITMFFFVPVN